MRPERLYICQINLTGVLQATGEVFEEHSNFTFQLSDLEVVQGAFFLFSLTRVFYRVLIFLDL
jgi:hypothetical protein